MLASRLLSILMLLQSRGRMSATELAASFEVSVRTIFRDIDQLSAAGIPVYAERGRAGGFQLLDGYRTKLTGLTGPEAEALFLAGLPGPAAELGLADLLATARLKLLAALPATMQPDVERITRSLHLDPAGWFRRAEPVALLPRIAEAIWTQHRLKIHYRRGGETYPRMLAPLGLVLKGGVWYLVALSGKTCRTYRAAQILDAEIQNDGFVRPKDFDLAAHWQHSSSAYEAGLDFMNVELRVSPYGRRLLENLGPDVLEAMTKSAGAPNGDGWIRCAIPLESGDSGLRELLCLGCEVEVLAPVELRTRRGQILARSAKLYGKGASDSPELG